MKYSYRLAYLMLLASPVIAVSACVAAGSEQAATESTQDTALPEQGDEDPTPQGGSLDLGPADPILVPLANAPITMCHIPPDDPSHPYTVRVPYFAVPKHLAHGDHLGPCTGGEGAGCLATGDDCTFDHQCCSGSCYFGMCVGASCLPYGEPCTFDHQCCSGDCREGVCDGGRGGCMGSGQECTFDHQCCSGSCQFGTCQ